MDPGLGPPYLVAFAPNGMVLAAAGSKTVRLWRVAGGNPVAAPTGHTEGSSRCAIRYSTDAFRRAGRPVPDTTQPSADLDLIGATLLTRSYG